MDHSSLVNGPKGEEYYVCPNCERNLVHRLSDGQVWLAALIAMPVLTIMLNFLFDVLFGQLLSGITIAGFEAVGVTSVIASIVVVIVLIRYSIQLVEQ